MPLGRHLILECHGCNSEELKDEVFLEKTMIDAAVTAKAEVLHSYFHKFDKGEGVTGVVALAESHISIHTWPEHGYMAVDVFMCGDCNPYDSFEYIINTMLVPDYNADCMDRGVEYGDVYK
jgi:S-adenosylmethionine decarboxylase